MPATRPEIELVYFDGCPHADEARANLRRALDGLGMSPDWEERVQDDDAPAWARKVPSPTIRIGGRNVLGEIPEVEGPACASGGAPSVEKIRRALGAAGR